MDDHLKMVDDIMMMTRTMCMALETEVRDLKEKLKTRDDEFDELMKKYEDLKIVAETVIDGAKASVANKPKLSPPTRRRGEHSETGRSTHVSTDEKAYIVTHK